MLVTHDLGVSYKPMRLMIVMWATEHLFASDWFDRSMGPSVPSEDVKDNVAFAKAFATV